MGPKLTILLITSSGSMFEAHQWVMKASLLHWTVGECRNNPKQVKCASILLSVFLMSSISHCVPSLVLGDFHAFNLPCLNL
jgi:hypothetical protein